MAFPGCKKGADDPFLSFRPRDKRLAQTWKLASFEGTRIMADAGATKTITYSFKNETINIVESPGDSKNFAYEYRMEIDKSGSMEAVEFLTDTTGQIESFSRGYWSWNNQAKKKSSVDLVMAGIFEGIETWDILRLAYNDMTLIADLTFIRQDPVEGNSRETVNFELIFGFDEQ
jgi:hypothetical protein